jgi:Rod binding domain-containing protein
MTTMSPSALALFPPGPRGPEGLKGLLSSASAAPGQTPADSLPQTAVEVEAIFLGHLLEQLRKALVQPVSRQSQELKGYLSIADQELARTLAAAGGIGLAQEIIDHLSRGQPVTSQENRHAHQTPSPGES